MKTEASENPMTQLAEDFADYLMQVWEDYEKTAKDIPPFGLEQVSMATVRRMWIKMTPEQQAAMLPDMPPELQRKLVEGGV